MHHLIAYPTLFRHYPDLYLLTVVLLFLGKWTLTLLVKFFNVAFVVSKFIAVTASKVISIVLVGIFFGLLIDALTEQR